MRAWSRFRSLAATMKLATQFLHLSYISPTPSFPLFYFLSAPFSWCLLNATALFTWKWRSVSPDDHWESQLRLKTSFHSNRIVLLYCFVSPVQLSHRRRPLQEQSTPSRASFCSTVYPQQQADSSSNPQLAGEDESQDLPHPLITTVEVWTRYNMTHFRFVQSCTALPEKTMNHFCREMDIFFFLSCSFTTNSDKIKKHRQTGPSHEHFGRTDARWQWVSGRLVEGGSNYPIWGWWSRERITALQHKAWHHSHMGLFRGCAKGNRQSAQTEIHLVSSN